MTNVRALVPAKDGGIGIWNGEEVAILKEVIAKGATDAELLLFSKVCERRQLDPFAKQIYFVKRDGKMTIQTGIDGFRSIADRTDAYAGNDEYRFDEGLTEYQHIKSGRGNPDTATATVYKLVKGVRCEFTATARWDEYYPGEKQGFMWRKMPYTMLGKVAESQALRRAFPEQLGGIYTDEEMAQADKDGAIEAEWSNVARESTARTPIDEPTGSGPLHPLGRERAAEAYRTIKSHGYSDDDINAWLRLHGIAGVSLMPQMTEADVEAMARDAAARKRPWLANRLAAQDESYNQEEPPIESTGELIGDDFDAEDADGQGAMGERSMGRRAS